MARPKGTTGVKQLTEADYTRIRTLFFDAKLSIPEIRSITKASKAQIRHAIRNEAPKKRSGRPRRLSSEQE